MVSARSPFLFALITVPRSVRLSAGGGRSPAVRIALTPGIASALRASIFLTRACGIGLSSSLQNSIPSARKSSADWQQRPLQVHGPLHEHRLEIRVGKRVAERPARAPRGEGIERRGHVARCRGGDARRPVRRQPLVDPEPDVYVVQVLVEEQVQPGLEVPAVGAVDAGFASGELARSPAAPAAAEGLEEVVGNVWCDETEPVTGRCRKARAVVRAAGAVAVQLT